MKQLVCLLLFIPLFLAAQTDERYLAGAVPVKEGKVIFSKEYKIPGYSKSRVYETMLEWAKANFNTDTKRIVYANVEKGEIAAVANKEYMEFSRTALSLDRARVTYRLTMECSDGLCKVELGGIRYEYDVSYQREPEKYLAEEWIIDKYALNKSQTKLNRISGKFRKGTINLADAYFEQIGNTFGQQLLAEGMAQTPAVTQPAAPSAAAAPDTLATAAVPSAPAVPAAPAAPSAPAKPASADSQAASATAGTPASSAASAPATPAPAGFTELTSHAIPSTLLDMLADNRLLVSPVSEEKAKSAPAAWGGIGNLFGNRIASISLPVDSKMKIGTNEIYRLSFSKDGETAPWMVLECRQQGETKGAQATTIMGEILHVWIK